MATKIFSASRQRLFGGLYRRICALRKERRLRMAFVIYRYCHWQGIAGRGVKAVSFVESFPMVIGLSRIR